MDNEIDKQQIANFLDEIFEYAYNQLPNDQDNETHYKRNSVVIKIDENLSENNIEDENNDKNDDQQKIEENEEQIDNKVKDNQKIDENFDMEQKETIKSISQNFVTELLKNDYEKDQEKTAEANKIVFMEKEYIEEKNKEEIIEKEEKNINTYDIKNITEEDKQEFHKVSTEFINDLFDQNFSDKNQETAEANKVIIEGRKSVKYTSNNLDCENNVQYELTPIKEEHSEKNILIKNLSKQFEEKNLLKDDGNKLENNHDEENMDENKKEILNENQENNNNEPPRKKSHEYEEDNSLAFINQKYDFLLNNNQDEDLDIRFDLNESGHEHIRRENLRTPIRSPKLSKKNSQENNNENSSGSKLLNKPQEQENNMEIEYNNIKEEENKINTENEKRIEENKKVNFISF